MLMQDIETNTMTYVNDLHGEVAPAVPFVMHEVPKEKQPNAGWQMIVNGDSWSEVSSATLRQEKMGIEITYGMRPEGYDGISIRELYGGGAVTIPYMIHPDTGRI